MTDRERAQAYLDKVNQNTTDPWEVATLPGIHKSEGPYFAQRYLEALDVLERIANLPEVFKTDVYPKALARQFLEGSGE
jgi:hypothetical protein